MTLDKHIYLSCILSRSEHEIKQDVWNDFNNGTRDFQWHLQVQSNFNQRKNCVFVSNHPVEFYSNHAVDCSKQVILIGRVSNFDIPHFCTFQLYFQCCLYGYDQMEK